MVSDIPAGDGRIVNLFYSVALYLEEHINAVFGLAKILRHRHRKTRWEGRRRW